MFDVGKKVLLYLGGRTTPDQIVLGVLHFDENAEEYYVVGQRLQYPHPPEEWDIIPDHDVLVPYTPTL